jgi:hypothetical protein
MQVKLADKLRCRYGVGMGRGGAKGRKVYLAERALSKQPHLFILCKLGHSITEVGKRAVSYCSVKQFTIIKSHPKLQKKV